MKTVVITGAGRGIGLATATKFLDEGWRVIGADLNTPIPLEHENLVAFQYDQADPDSIAAFAGEVARVAPSLDALINNAGVLLDASDSSADPVKVRTTLEVNVVGVVDLTERLLPLMHKGTHIVNMDSGYGSISEPELDNASSAGYRISKAALNMYTRHLAFRLESQGILVSSLAPGWVSTDMGNSLASATNKPDRTPEQAASDIFHLVTTVTETGQFWRLGKKTAW